MADVPLKKMTFAEHFEELRIRLLICVIGVVVAFVVCLCFKDLLVNIVLNPYESLRLAREAEEGAVELLGPEGDPLGSVRLREAYRRLRARLERRLAEEAAGDSRRDLEEGLSRLETWSRRMVRERERPT